MTDISRGSAPPNRPLAIILFVCSNNLCVSPTAEGIFREVIDREGLRGKLVCDSAGTFVKKVGELPHPYMREVAEKYGIHLVHKSRSIKPEDFLKFDYILASDRPVYTDLERMRKQVPNAKATVWMARSFEDSAAGNKELPDPTYGTMLDFEKAYGVIEYSVNHLMMYFRRRFKL